jgi:hypothetical protein
MIRRRVSWLFLLAAAIVPCGCATNTWKDHFHAMSAGSPGAGDVTIERKDWDALAAFKPGAGERVVGESRFESAYMPDLKDLGTLAKDVGATRVYWSSEFSRTAITEGSMSRPRDISSRGVTTFRGSDGKEQRVTTETTTTVWESVPYSRTDQVYRYLAIFTAGGS